MDNTLYDWLTIWHASFDALIESASAISGVSRDLLEAEARTVHQRCGGPEYSHLLQELPSLGYEADRDKFMKTYRPAIDGFRRARSDAMSLYAGVLETIEQVKACECPVVAYTETSAFYTALRLRWLGLDGVLDRVYSPPDHDFPEWVNPAALRTRADDQYPLQCTSHHFTPRSHFKPDTTILSAILHEYKVPAAEALYVGDSLAKDIAMAQALGVHDAYARYGVGQHRAEYELLRRVSHWTDADIERERALLEQPPVIPSVTLGSFADLLEIFAFGVCDGRGTGD